MYSLLFLLSFLIVPILQGLSLVKCNRIWKFLIVSILAIAAALGLDYLGGYIGYQASGDFHVAAFAFQLFMPFKAILGVFVLIIGIIIIDVKEPYYNRKKVLAQLIFVAIAAFIAIGALVVKKLVQDHEANKFPGFVFSGTEFGTDGDLIAKYKGRIYHCDIKGYYDISYVGDDEILAYRRESNGPSLVRTYLDTHVLETLIPAGERASIRYPISNNKHDAVFFVSDYRTVQKLDLNTKKVSTVFKNPDEYWVGRLRIDSNDRYLYYNIDLDENDDNSPEKMKLYRFDLVSGENELVFSDDSYIEDFDLASNDDTIVYYCNYQLRSYKISTGEKKVVLENAFEPNSSAHHGWLCQLSHDDRYVLYFYSGDPDSFLGLKQCAYAYDLEEQRTGKVISSRYTIDTLDWIYYNE